MSRVVVIKRVLGVALLLVLILSSWSLASGVGAFSAFRNGIGGRALGMGGAFVAIADDSTAGVWNPAGLALLTEARVGAMSADLFSAGVTHQFIAGATPLGGFGIGLVWERDSVLGQVIDEEGNPGVTFGWNESAARMTAAAKIAGPFIGGASVTYYLEDSGLGDRAAGIGFDLGVLVDLGDGLTLGLAARDLGGTTVGWSTGATDTVLGSWRAGVAALFADKRAILTAELDSVGGAPGDLRLGVEFKPVEALALRGGAVFRDWFRGGYVTLGIGVTLPRFCVDAAYLLESRLGNTLVVSIEVSLGNLLGGGK